MHDGRKIFILKLDDIKGMITMKYETDFDFEFDMFKKPILKSKDQGFLSFDVYGKNRKDGLMDYVDAF